MLPPATFCLELRGNKTAIELFIAGVQGWEVGLRRRMEDGGWRMEDGKPFSE